MKRRGVVLPVVVVLLALACGAGRSALDRGPNGQIDEVCPEPPYAECTCACATSFADPVQEAYRTAVCDAASAEATEVVDSLVPLVPGTPDLRWKEIDGVPRVLVVTWAEKSWAENLKEGEPVDVKGKWVTLAPFVQRLCRASTLSGSDLDQRLRQLLGLWPKAPYTHFVELWMAPDQLLRPCPDSDVTDRRCDLEFPEGTPGDYRKWFATRRGTSRWFGCEKQWLFASPFTGLGYTYDWSGAEVGPSEYVARGEEGTVGPKKVSFNFAIVSRIRETAKYCSPETPLP